MEYRCPGCGNTLLVEQGVDSAYCPACDTTYPVKSTLQADHGRRTPFVIFVLCIIGAGIGAGVAFIGYWELNYADVHDLRRRMQAIEMTMLSLEPYHVVELADDTDVIVEGGQACVNGLGRTEQNVIHDISAVFVQRRFGGRTRWIRKHLSIDGQTVGNRVRIVRSTPFIRRTSLERTASVVPDTRTIPMGEIVELLSKPPESGLAIGRVLSTGEVGAIRASDTEPVETLLEDLPDGYRLWIDNTGNFTAVAKLLKSNDNSVTLQTVGGNEVHVELRRLSARDRAYVDSRFQLAQDQ